MMPRQRGALKKDIVIFNFTLGLDYSYKKIGKNLYLPIKNLLTTEFGVMGMILFLM